MPIDYRWITTTQSFFANNLVTAGNQALPAIGAMNWSTTYLTSWFDGAGDVKGRAFDRFFGALGDETTVNGTLTNNQTDPAILPLADGTYRVVFTDYSVDPGGDIRMVAVNSVGGAGGEAAIAATSSDDFDPDIAGLADGGYVVTWTRDFGGGDLDVEAMIFNSNGTVRLNAFAANASISLSTAGAQVAGLANGNFVVTYMCEAKGGGSDTAVFRIYDSSGLTVKSETTIDAFGSINDDIQVVALLDGGFAVAYADNGWVYDQTEVTLRIYNADGSARSDYILVNTDTAGAQTNPTLTTLSNGYLVVGWISNGITLYEQAYTQAGIAAGANDFVNNQVLTAEIAGLADGMVANVRVSSVTDGDGNSIRSSVEQLVRDTIGDDFGNILVGDALVDIITGNGGNDTITGGLASDTLSGGLGNDNFRDMGAGLNGDLITDFDRFDRIQILDANAATFTYSLSGNVLTYSGGSIAFAAGHAPTALDMTESPGSGIILELANQFQNATFELAAFGYSAGGWNNSSRYSREVADVNGDGMVDILGFAEDGVFVSLATGGGNYGPATFTFAGFGASASAGGWNNEFRYPRMLADVNGDNRADIVGFAEDGVFVSLATGAGHFGVSTFTLAGFGAGVAAGGWNNETRYPRELADVNGDGRADIVGFGEDGVFVALASASGGFGVPTYTYNWFGASAAAGGWNNEDRYARKLADVNGDGMADIVGFAEAGVFVALATGGGHFGPGTFAVGDFGAGEGWSSDRLYPRELGDVDGDGNLDIIGFGGWAVWVSYGHGDGTFDAHVDDIQNFTPTQGWSNQSLYPRYVGDADGDHAVDIIGLADGGVFVSLSNGDLLI